MFNKKPLEKKEEAVEVEPVKAEEISEIEQEEESEANLEDSADLTLEQTKEVLQKLASDVQMIKYHLRLDFL